MYRHEWSDIQRDLDLLDLKILYLKSEQQKRREELDALWRELAKQRKYLDIIASRDFIKQIDDPDIRKKLREIVRIWKSVRKT
jgi:peptidoglycan hydrolase CwlO-like protein